MDSFKKLAVQVNRRDMEMIFQLLEIIRCTPINGAPDQQGENRKDRNDVPYQQLPEQSSASSFCLIGKAVPVTPHRQNEARLGGIVLDLLAEFADVHVDNPINHRLAVLIALTQEFLTGKGLPGRAHQSMQKLVFPRCQGNKFPGAGNPVFLGIQFQAVKREDCRSRLVKPVCCGAGSP